MHYDDPALTQLTKDECLDLLASVSVGRIIFTRRALPAAELVNFVLDHGDIVIRMDRGDQIAVAVREAIVAFEADDLNPVGQAGWTVTVIGRSQEVTDPEDIDRFKQLCLSSWVPAGREHFFRMSPEILTGRRLHAHDHSGGLGTRDISQAISASVGRP
jgi:hypothetical protein